MKYKNNINADTQGYLFNTNDWNEDLAIEIARLEGIVLKKEHWQVIHFVRDFYLKYNTSPSIRMLVKAIKQAYGNDRINSVYLVHLFPHGPSKQIAKIAGIPKPVICL